MSYDEGGTLLFIGVWEHEHCIQDLDTSVGVNIDAVIVWGTVE